LAIGVISPSSLVGISPGGSSVKTDTKVEKSKKD
jgi:hypothetical protein